MKKLPEPESQIQEVLYELINRLYIDRRTMMLSAGILNLTARITNLRNQGLRNNIITKEIETINKYGRKISFAQYSLVDKKQAREFYLKLKQNQAGLPNNE